MALKSLATEAQSLTRSSSSSSLPDSCLVDGLQEALLQFHRLTQNSKQVNDVIYVTCSRTAQSLNHTVFICSKDLLPAAILFPACFTGYLIADRNFY